MKQTDLEYELVEVFEKIEAKEGSLLLPDEMAQAFMNSEGFNIVVKAVRREIVSAIMEERKKVESVLMAGMAHAAMIARDLELVAE